MSWMEGQKVNQRGDVQAIAAALIAKGTPFSLHNDEPGGPWWFSVQDLEANAEVTQMKLLLSRARERRK